MTKVLVDAWAWIEYLEGSKDGQLVNEYLTNKDNEIYALNITLTEVVSKVKRKKGNAELAYTAIMKRATILNQTEKEAYEAGLLHAHQRKTDNVFGIVDALLLTVARMRGLKLLSNDGHFDTFQEVKSI